MPLVKDETVHETLDCMPESPVQSHSELHYIAEQQSKLLNMQSQILQQLAHSQKPPKKDFWDRVAAIAPILSGCVIALGGAYFTTLYNEQQLKLQEVQTIEKFIPHLLGDEKSKRAAVLAISSLGNAKLAARVASIFASPGTVSALESIAHNNQNVGDKKALNGALDRALDNMAEGYRVEKRYEDAINTYKKVLALREKTYGKDSARVVPSIDRLAQLYITHNEYSDAEALLKRSAEIQKAEFGVESMQYADQLRKLSSLYAEQGLSSKAQSLLSQAASIEQKIPLAQRSTAAKSEDGDDSSPFDEEISTAPTFNPNSSSTSNASFNSISGPGSASGSKELSSEQRPILESPASAKGHENFKHEPVKREPSKNQEKGTDKTGAESGKAADIRVEANSENWAKPEKSVETAGQAFEANSPN